MAANIDYRVLPPNRKTGMTFKWQETIIFNVHILTGNGARALSTDNVVFTCDAPPPIAENC
jgi:hypothetical protein